MNAIRVRMGQSGRIVIPRPLRDAMAISPGDDLWAWIEEDGLRLVTATTAIVQAQSVVRRYVPEGVSLVDELLDERRQE